MAGNVMKSAGSLYLDSSLNPEQEPEHWNMNKSDTVDWYHANQNLTAEFKDAEQTSWHLQLLRTYIFLFLGRLFVVVCTYITADWSVHF